MICCSSQRHPTLLALVSLKRLVTELYQKCIHSQQSLYECVYKWKITFLRTANLLTDKSESLCGSLAQSDWNIFGGMPIPNLDDILD